MKCKNPHPIGVPYSFDRSLTRIGNRVFEVVICQTCRQPFVDEVGDDDDEKYKTHNYAEHFDK